MHTHREVAGDTFQLFCPCKKEANWLWTLCCPCPFQNKSLKTGSTSENFWHFNVILLIFFFLHVKENTLFHFSTDLYSERAVHFFSVIQVNNLKCRERIWTSEQIVHFMIVRKRLIPVHPLHWTPVQKLDVTFVCTSTTVSWWMWIPRPHTSGTWSRRWQSRGLNAVCCTVPLH